MPYKAEEGCPQASFFHEVEMDHPQVFCSTELRRTICRCLVPWKREIIWNLTVLT